MSSSVLYDRLRELTNAGLIRRDRTEAYALTPMGRSLGAALDPLDDWARQWGRSRARAHVTT